MATKKKKIDGLSVHCAFDEAVDLSELVENPRNPNKHPTKQVKLLAKIIGVQGWRAPITVSRRSGFIVRGHGRYAAAKELGAKKVPVDWQEYQSEAEEWADLIADNRIAELSDLYLPDVRELMQSFDTGEIDLELTGFEGDDLENLMAWAPGDAELPDELPGPGVEGDDDTMQKLILVYENKEERARWFEILGVEDRNEQKMVFSLDEIT